MVPRRLSMSKEGFRYFAVGPQKVWKTVLNTTIQQDFLSHNKHTHTQTHTHTHTHTHTQTNLIRLEGRALQTLVQGRDHTRDIAPHAAAAAAAAAARLGPEQTRAPAMCH